VKPPAPRLAGVRKIESRSIDRERVMRVVVDSAVCQGHTLCALAAPDIFGLDDEDGHAFALVDTVPAGLHEAAKRAALGCPEGAITLVEGKADETPR
jgi:ferredoxin